MERILITSSNKEFPRVSSAAIHSGAVPGSAAGGPRCSVENPFAPEDVGSPPARRPRASLKQAIGVVFLWDSGEFDTVEIAQAMRVHESEVESILHHIREERRARS
jgi:hypothetical protein